MRGVLRKLRGLPPGQRRLFWLMMALTLVIGVVPAWLLVNGHAAIAIALLVAFYILPEFVLIPLRIRRSRRAAEAARVRRRGSA